MKNRQCDKVPQYKCNKNGGLHCLGCKTYNIYCAGIRKGREIEIENNKKKLKALEIIKECFSLNGFDELIPNDKWFESEDKQKLLKEVLK